MPRIPSDAVQGAGSWIELKPLTWGEAKCPPQDVEALILGRVIAWNWVDFDGQLLPVPQIAADLDALTVDEVQWLSRAIAGDTKAEKAKADALLASLWTHSPKGQPNEYVEYILCKEIYHCTPEELARQDASTVRLHLGFYNAEQKHREAERKAAARKRGKKG